MSIPLLKEALPTTSDGNVLATNNRSSRVNRFSRCFALSSLRTTPSKISGESTRNLINPFVAIGSSAPNSVCHVAGDTTAVKK